MSHPCATMVAMDTKKETAMAGGTDTIVKGGPFTPVIDMTITPRVGRYTTVTQVTELYCPACTTGIICWEEVDVDAFVATHFDCVPDGYA